MAGITDIFRMAAEGVDKIPWRWKLLAGTVGGAAIGASSKDDNLTFGQKVARGMAIGGVGAFGSGMLLRAAGHGTEAMTSIGRAVVTNKFSEVKLQGLKALMKPGTLMLGGAAAGAIIAPEGHKTQGALIGGGLGLAARPVKGFLNAWNAMGNVKGLQTVALLTTSAVAVSAAGIFSRGTVEGQGATTSGIGGTIDYEPLSGSMKDRMLAMNATGDIVLGLHGRQHG